MTVYKLIEVVGTSGTSVDDAIRGAVERASTSVEDLRWFEVKEIRGRIDEANRPEYQVKLNIGFTVHAPQNIEKVQARRGGKEPMSRDTRSKTAQVAAKKGQRKKSGVARNFEKQRSK